MSEQTLQERLRVVADKILYFKTGRGQYIKPVEEILREAADALDDRDRQLDELQAHADNAVREMNLAMAKCDVLAEALRTIEGLKYRNDTEGFLAIEQARQVAREALASLETPSE